MDLQTALQNINFAVATTITPNYALFNYGPYSGYTIQNTSGGPITTLQEFVEGISKTVCVVENDLYNFTLTIYPANQAILSSAITALTIPGLAYTYSAGGLSISIANTDDQLTILTKLANAIGDTGDILAAPGNAWSLLSITQPTTIYAAFNNLINYNVTQNATIAGKQASIGTFNNSINCLSTVGGTSTDDVATTINLLTQYTCALEKFDAGIVPTPSCLTAQADLQSWIQYLISIADNNQANALSAVDGTSIIATSSGPCSGYTIGVDPAWTGLSKVVTSAQDTTPGTLTDKLLGGPNVILTPSAPGNQTLTIDVVLTNDAKVGVNSSDVTPDYLVSKIPAAQGTWGIALVPTVTPDNSQLLLTPTVNNPYELVQNIINYISTNPELLAAFCALKTQCDGCQCLAATAFTVTADLGNTEFNLSWTAGTSLGETQTVSYREQGATAWISSANIDLANPQAYTTTSAIVKNLNTNTVYEFQIVSNCGTGPNYSAIVTGIIYSQETLLHGVNNSYLSVNQASMPTVDIVEYILLDNNLVPIENAAPVTGSNPVVQFNTAVSSATTYYVQYRYGTLINGVTLYSDDPSQAGAWYSQTITTP
jgi:hypothetical protein